MTTERAHLKTEAAIWAEGTSYTADEILAAFEARTETDLGFCEFCEQVLKIANTPEGRDNEWHLY